MNKHCTLQMIAMIYIQQQYVCRAAPASTTHCSSAGLMLVHSLQFWPNIKTALVRRVVLAGETIGFQSAT